jgi:hypothetical protein
MKTAELFQSVELSQDVPNTKFHQGDIGIIVEYLEPNETQSEAGYLLEMFQNGETLDVIAVPISWAKPFSNSEVNPVPISSINK